MELQTSWNPFKRPTNNKTKEVQVSSPTQEDIRTVLEANIFAIVDDKNEASVKTVLGDQTLIFEVKVSKGDVGKVIGKQGKTAQALRTIVNCMAAKAKIRCVLEIVE
jgi:predicted RNA-binding protein YlqC (UPF0109 family)